MRADKKKSLSKVAKIAIKNPTLSEREIAWLAWVSNWTAHNMVKELEQAWAKNDDIIRITNKDKKAIELAQIIIEQSLERYVEQSESSWWLEMAEALRAAWLAKEATARFTLFRWDVTDDNWGLKTISKEQADLIAKLYGNT